MKYILLVLVVIAGIYLVYPSSDFPEPPPGSRVSDEPADTESIYRRAFYTDLSRQEIMNYYVQQFSAPLQFKLILPPEDATAVIRDQTRSSYLEEIVHPGKESLYVDGFVPVKVQDKLIVDNREYASKIVVRLVPSTLATRFTVLVLVSMIGYLMLKEYV